MKTYDPPNLWPLAWPLVILGLILLLISAIVLMAGCAQSLPDPKQTLLTERRNELLAEIVEQLDRFENRTPR